MRRRAEEPGYDCTDLDDFEDLLADKPVHGTWRPALGLGEIHHRALPTAS